MKKNPYRIGPLFILKIAGLIIIFLTAVYSMYYLNTRGIEKTAFGSIFSASENQEEWQVCSKELLSFSYDSVNPQTSWKLLKAQDHWRLLFNNSIVRLSVEQMNKCVQAVCKLKVRKRSQQEFVDFKESLNYQFIDMTSLIIRLNSTEKSVFWEGNLYDASDLIDYLAKVPGHHCK